MANKLVWDLLKIGIGISNVSDTVGFLNRAMLDRISSLVTSKPSSVSSDQAWRQALRLSQSRSLNGMVRIARSVAGPLKVGRFQVKQ